MFFVTRKAGLNIKRAGKWDYLFPNKNCRKILVIENHLWVGTSSGALRFDGKKWKIFKEELLLLPEVQNSTNGDVLFSSEGKGVMVLSKNGDWKLIDKSNGLINLDIQTIEEYTPGIFWVGHAKGIDVIDIK